ncbi:MAG: 5-oxoprolinase subunit PxpB [Acidobacteriota bacterium]|nr:5-oxoprolinase subunit PxpB [Acidobacteriota bacterium]
MQFRYASDQSLLISFGNHISTDVHRQVRKLLRSLQHAPLPAVWNLHPSYSSLLLRFDPCRVEYAELEHLVRDRIAQLDDIELPPARTVEIPVRYGGETGPDLDALAAIHGISASEVVGLHSEAVYTVYFLGFVPGFAYLGGLPDSLSTPRRASPRKKVEAGSVGIGGSQTGVYPFATPGGWQIIGRTPLELFNAERDSMSLLEIGDIVRFRPMGQ